MAVKSRLVVTMGLTATVEVPDHVVQGIAKMEARGESRLARVRWAKEQLKYSFPIEPQLPELMSLVNILAKE